jgi:hypothetical protein
MRKHLAKRVALVAHRRGPDAPPFIRIVTVLRPDLPEAAQERWLGAAERLVDDELRRQGPQRVLLWSHVDAPRVVSVDSPGGRFLVEVDDDQPTPTARIVERDARRW